MSGDRDRLAEVLADVGGGSTDGWEPFADALLPVVDRIANERAAAELRKAADWIWDEAPALASASAQLHARADALDPT